ncbi:hypothetical protein LIER_24750 [Lithospermum erythrorhizon]|uniref:Reverse transcriptase domain-containing protein n=1 Tax=Lithospermum erythrorhizon TaxID=34254 RepID=A0AAV3R603_LITER
MKQVWFIQGSPIKMFKWSVDFSPDKESSIKPVWVHFPGLPLYLFDPEPLASIANSIGHPIRYDSHNINRVKLGVASIWIGFEDEADPANNEGFWQLVEYEFVPSYCTDCSHVGHLASQCKGNKRLRDSSKTVFDDGGPRKKYADSPHPHTTALSKLKSVFKDWQKTEDGRQHVHLLLSYVNINFSFYITFVYAASKAPDRKVLWQALNNVAQVILPWSDGKVFSRLDRVLMNAKGMEVFPLLSVRHLARTTSDHSPLLVHARTQYEGKKGAFRFQSMWIKHAGLEQVVNDCWNRPVFGEPMVILCSKLKDLKKELKKWNIDVFGNVISLVESSEEEVIICEKIFEDTNTDAAKQELKKAKAQHVHNLEIEEEFLRQKSRIKWIKEADKSTSFFHAVIKNKHRRYNIPGTLIDGHWITENNLIAESDVQHFKVAFSNDLDPDYDEPLIDCIPNSVTDQQNTYLIAQPSLQEVRNVVFDMDRNSAAGPDGFNGTFFLHFWDIIAHDVNKAVSSFMTGQALPKAMTSTAIVLIPKCDGALTWKQYRPISLCNFTNKIISKVMSSRLANILPTLISEYQAGFVKHRLIQDNILLTRAHPLQRPALPWREFSAQT